MRENTLMLAFSILAMCLGHAICIADDVPSKIGPTEAFIRALNLKKGPGNEAGVWPAKQRLADALPPEKLPPKYIAFLASWIPRVVQEKVCPAKLQTEDWRGIRALWYGRDYIVGRQEAGDGQTVLEFQSFSRAITLGFLFKQPMMKDQLDAITDDQMRQLLGTYLKIPAKEIPRIVFKERRVETLAGTLVCYGTIETNWNWGNPINNEWWEQFSFWMTQDGLRVSVYMVDWRNKESTSDQEDSMWGFGPVLP